MFSQALFHVPRSLHPKEAGITNTLLAFSITPKINRYIGALRVYGFNYSFFLAGIQLVFFGKEKLVHLRHVLMKSVDNSLYAPDENTRIPDKITAFKKLLCKGQFRFLCKRLDLFLRKISPCDTVYNRNLSQDVWALCPA